MCAHLLILTKMSAYLQRLSTPCTTQNERIATIKTIKNKGLSRDSVIIRGAPVYVMTEKGIEDISDYFYTISNMSTFEKQNKHRR